MEILTYETAKNEGAREALNKMNKWLIISETLPAPMLTEYLKLKIEEIKKQYK